MPCAFFIFFVFFCVPCCWNAHYCYYRLTCCFWSARFYCARYLQRNIRYLRYICRLGTTPRTRAHTPRNVFRHLPFVFVTSSAPPATVLRSSCHTVHLAFSFHSKPASASATTCHTVLGFLLPVPPVFADVLPISLPYSGIDLLCRFRHHYSPFATEVTPKGRSSSLFPYSVYKMGACVELFFYILCLPFLPPVPFSMPVLILGLFLGLVPACQFFYCLQVKPLLVTRYTCYPPNVMPDFGLIMVLRHYCALPQKTPLRHVSTWAFFYKLPAVPLTVTLYHRLTAVFPNPYTQLDGRNTVLITIITYQYHITLLLTRATQYWFVFSPTAAQF